MPRPFKQIGKETESQDPLNIHFNQSHIDFLFTDIPEDPEEIEAQKFSFFPYFWKDFNYSFSNTILEILFFAYSIGAFCSSFVFFFTTPEGLARCGGNFIAYTAGGQYWRLISNVFLHSNMVLLLINLFALLHILGFLQFQIGKIRLLSVFILSGILGSALALLDYDMSVKVGSTPSIFGLYGALSFLILKGRVKLKKNKNLLINIGLFSVFCIFWSIYHENSPLFPLPICFLFGFGLCFSFYKLGFIFNFNKGIIYSIVIGSLLVFSMGFISLYSVPKGLILFGDHYPQIAKNILSSEEIDAKFKLSSQEILQSLKDLEQTWSERAEELDQIQVQALPKGLQQDYQKIKILVNKNLLLFNALKDSNYRNEKRIGLGKLEYILKKNQKESLADLYQIWK